MTDSTSKFKDKEEVLRHFVTFAAQALRLQAVPAIKIVNDPQLPQKLKSLGYFNGKQIVTYLGPRLMADVLRTLGHELVHQRQNEIGKLDDPKAGDTGSPQENEANSIAGILLRLYGKQNPSIYDM